MHNEIVQGVANLNDVHQAVDNDDIEELNDKILEAEDIARDRADLLIGQGNAGDVDYEAEIGKLEQTANQEEADRFREDFEMGTGSVIHEEPPAA